MQSKETLEVQAGVSETMRERKYVMCALHGKKREKKKNQCLTYPSHMQVAQGWPKPQHHAAHKTPTGWFLHLMPVLQLHDIHRSWAAPEVKQHAPSRHLIPFLPPTKFLTTLPASCCYCCCVSSQLCTLVWQRTWRSSLFSSRWAIHYLPLLRIFTGHQQLLRKVAASSASDATRLQLQASRFPILILLCCSGLGFQRVFSIFLIHPI